MSKSSNTALNAVFEDLAPQTISVFSFVHLGGLGLSPSIFVSITGICLQYNLVFLIAFAFLLFSSQHNVMLEEFLSGRTSATSWIATVLHILFGTLSMAAGLYYIAEWVEEYTVLTAKIIRYFILFTSAVFLGLLLIEQMPYYITGFGLLANVIHWLLLKEFPYISLTSPVFLVGVALVFVNHYLAFAYFARVYYSFSEILGYFTICMWLVPFSFFVSLSVNEYTLPTMQTTDMGMRASLGSPAANVLHVRRPKRPGILGLFDFFIEKKDDLLGRNKAF